ncbi:hypothetical protein THRCLA_20658 [Thraustotheca clavata]|uniref:Uncharacterized protein n=1 Tax=Thraustotheca clavata TaxID=74557 RepID=A0A1W0A4Y8_9STRA|nr:hypothetical protein THRCLA_20658 [Thraustotheca clavata]
MLTFEYSKLIQTLVVHKLNCKPNYILTDCNGLRCLLQKDALYTQQMQLPNSNISISQKPTQKSCKRHNEWIMLRSKDILMYFAIITGAELKDALYKLLYMHTYNVW